MPPKAFPLSSSRQDFIPTITTTPTASKRSTSRRWRASGGWFTRPDAAWPTSITRPRATTEGRASAKAAGERLSSSLALCRCPEYIDRTLVVVLAPGDQTDCRRLYFGRQKWPDEESSNPEYLHPPGSESMAKA